MGVATDSHKLFPIHKPTLGIYDNIPGTELNPKALVNASNMQVDKGVLAQRYGYPAYGTNTNLVGTPYLFFPFTSFAGVTTLYCITSNGMYYLNGSAWAAKEAVVDFITTHRYPSACSIEDKILVTSSEKGLYEAGSGRLSGWSGYGYCPRIILPYKFRLIGFGEYESGATVPLRIRYSALGACTTITETYFIDWIDGDGIEIVGAIPLGPYIAIFKDKSAGLMDWIGGSSIFSLNIQLPSTGLIAQRAVVNVGGRLFFISHDNIYSWDGGREAVPIGDPIKDLWLADIASNEANLDKASFAMYVAHKGQVYFFYLIGTAASYVTKYFMYDIKHKSWWRGQLGDAIICADYVYYSGYKALMAIKTKTPVHFDYSTKQDNGKAITSFIESPDFVISEEEYIMRKKRYFAFVFDMKGDASDTVKFERSVDEGSNYATSSNLTVAASYDRVKKAEKFTDRKARIKLTHDTDNKRWFLRFYGIDYTLREKK
jgi:hypothetical protein